MPEHSFLINNKVVNYLIHGQPFTFRYQIEKCLFVVIHYNNELVHNRDRVKWLNKKYYIKKSEGVFTNVTNAFQPNITIYCFGFGIWKLKKPLNVNFVNLKTPDLRIKEKKLTINSQLEYRKPRINFELSKNLLSNLVIKNNSMTLLKNEIRLKDIHDFEHFKQNYKPI
jgi:hypothetical protein